ncbi:MAG: FHA domain-containing protein [Lachnospiraceae bacterium]|nr:FHA domain-containing protein [Lachnospiraceae bacterium]
MDVSYQRSPNRSYMILSGEESGEGYEEEMLRQNAVTLLLSFYMIELDKGLQVWYDITRLRSVRDIVRQEGVTVENIYMFLNGIATAFSMLSQYLISQKNIIIDPDTVYFDRETPPGVRLCYCPLVHEDYSAQLQGLMSFFMEEVDHEKDQITKLVYELYEMCQDPVSLEELVDAVRREMPDDINEKAVIKDISFDGPISREPGEFSVQQDLEQSYLSKDAEPSSTSKDRKLFSSKERRTFTPSKDRMISEYSSDPYEEEQAVIPKKKAKRWDNMSLGERIKGFFAEKFPVLAKTGKKGRKNQEDQSDAPHDFSQDFVFDPDTDILTKTVFMKPENENDHTSEAGFQGVLIYDGKGEEQNHYINGSSFRIGSQENDNEAVLHSKVVSRHHAMITKSGSSFFIEDLNSTNGTYVNGTLLPYRDKVKLKKMDQIVFADVAYHII